MLALLVLVLARVHAAVGAHADFEQPSAGAVPIVRPLPRHAPSHGASGGNFRKLPAAGRIGGLVRRECDWAVLVGSCLPQGAQELREDRWEPLDGGVVRAGEPTVVRHRTH
jgi:hypothetical protein